MLALMLQAGITLPAALNCCRRSLPLAAYRRALHTGVLRLRQGVALSGPARSASFSAPVPTADPPGEAAGRLAAVSRHLGSSIATAHSGAVRRWPHWRSRPCS
ncbi:hypothetical protein O0544_03695 [Edwardsiella anguillarum]|nr:hypothetical protein [Edwardsiella anguillarum]